jgi:hypothetical protein
MTARPTVTGILVPIRATMRSAPPAPRISPPMSGSSRTPAPKASCPCTDCRYCGSVNSIPNRAEVPIVAATVPHRNRGRRNRPRSIMGYGLRRSQITNAINSSAPRPIAASTSVVPQPRRGTSMTP